MKRSVDFQALELLKTFNGKLTRQQYKTLRGQIIAGDAAGALKGLQTLLDRK